MFIECPRFANVENGILTYAQQREWDLEYQRLPNRNVQS